MNESRENLSREIFYGYGLDLWSDVLQDKQKLDDLLDYLEVYRGVKSSIVKIALGESDVEIPEFGNLKRRFKIRINTLVNFLRLSSAIVQYGADEVFNSPEAAVYSLRPGETRSADLRTLTEYEKIGIAGGKELDRFKQTFRTIFPESSDFARLSSAQVSFLVDVTTNLLNFGLENVRSHWAGRIQRTKKRFGR